MNETIAAMFIAAVIVFIGAPLIAIAIAILYGLAKPLIWIKTQMELEQKTNELRARTEK